MRRNSRILWKLGTLVVALLLMISAAYFAVAQQHLFLASAATPHISHPRPYTVGASYHVLFDNAHTETAGNADWVISTSQPDPLKQNPNPQKETDWTGGLSAWGVALQQTERYNLKTNTTSLTYGDTTNPLDLQNFNVLILPEPNSLFTQSEKMAIFSFVRDGGGLFMIADHTGSDRNNDGVDSLQVLNDLMNTGGGPVNDPFGIQFNSQNIARDYPAVDTANPDPLLQGPFGNDTTSLIANGTTESIYPPDNPTATGVIFVTGAVNTGTTGVFVAHSTYGKGRVVTVGDSSAIDDGTCAAKNKCFNGWGDPHAQDATLFLNGTEWLAAGTPGQVISKLTPAS